MSDVAHGPLVNNNLSGSCNLSYTIILENEITVRTIKLIKIYSLIMLFIAFVSRSTVNALLNEEIQKALTEDW